MEFMMREHASAPLLRGGMDAKPILEKLQQAVAKEPSTIARVNMRGIQTADVGFITDVFVRVLQDNPGLHLVFLEVENDAIVYYLSKTLEEHGLEAQVKMGTKPVVIGSGVLLLDGGEFAPADLPGVDVEYLYELLTARRDEIERGDNAATADPVYVILDLVEHVVSGHDELLTETTNLAEREPEHGYLDNADDPDGRAFYGADKLHKLEDPVPVTRFWVDRPVAFFLTSEGAHNYKRYQSHNLTDPYVYVFSAGYRNAQAFKLSNKYLRD